MPPDVVELATSRGFPAAPGLYRVRAFAAGDGALVDGLPVTSVRRTLLDLGQVTSDAVVERALEWALRKRHVSVDELRAAVATKANQPGTRALRHLLTHRPPGLPPTDSDAETLFVQLVRRTGLPEPQRQFPVPTAEGTFRVDFAWPARRLGVEIDGAGTHASREALRRDLRRQNRLMLSLTAGGWILLRFTWDDVTDERYEGQLSAQLREAWVIGLNLAR